MTSILSRKTLRILAVATCVSTTISAEGFAEPPAKSKGNGAYMEVFGTDSTGCIWLHAYASRTGTTTAPQTWLSYDVYNLCTNEWIAYGYGSVANTALKVTNKAVTLIVTPTAGPNFYRDGVAGAINLTLTPDGVFSSSFSGHRRSEYLGVVYQSHGSWTSGSAAVSGNVLGFAAVNTSAEFGTSRERYMEIDRGPK